ncbi:MAG: YncE family protein, partial [Terriglobia bacterium]
LYINLTGTDEIGVVDVKLRRLVAHWPLPGVHTAHGIGLDEADHRLFTASRNPARFAVFNMDTGHVVADMPCTGVNSDLWYDAARKRIYVTGTGTISVFQQRDPDHYVHIADVPSAYRGKSSIFVPQLNRLYVADSSKGKPGATMALQIFEVQP